MNKTRFISIIIIIIILITGCSSRKDKLSFIDQSEYDINQESMDPFQANPLSEHNFELLDGEITLDNHIIDMGVYNGDIYILPMGSNEIYCFNEELQLIKTIKQDSIILGFKIVDDNIYIVNNDEKKLVLCDLEGNEVESYYIERNHELYTTSQIIFLDNGDIYMSSNGMGDNIYQIELKNNSINILNSMGDKNLVGRLSKTNFPDKVAFIHTAYGEGGKNNTYIYHGYSAIYTINEDKIENMKRLGDGIIYNDISYYDGKYYLLRANDIVVLDKDLEYVGSYNLKPYLENEGIQRDIEFFDFMDIDEKGNIYVYLYLDIQSNKAKILKGTAK